MESGRIHRRGTGATFWVRWFVMESRSMDPQAAKPIQGSFSPKGAASTASFRRAGASEGLSRRLHQATREQRTAKKAKDPDHRRICRLEERWGSIRKGKQTR